MSDPMGPEILAEAARWMALLGKAPPKPTDLTAFRSWLDEDPLHARAMAAVERTWSLSATELPKLPRFQAVQAADTARLARGHAPRRTLRPAFAAIALLLMLAGSALLYRLETVAPTIYATGPGERAEVQLADGSRLRLDAQTRLSVRLLWRARDVQVEQGAAEFVVAHDPLRPFTVATSRVAVRAIGTDFAVRRDADETSVVLVAGVVDLRDPKSGEVRARMVPNQKASYDATATVPTMRTVRVADELAWRSGQIVLDRVRLGDAVHRFARYATAEIRVAPDLNDLEVSGVYKADWIEGFLDGLVRVQPVRWYRDDSGAYVIARRGRT